MQLRNNIIFRSVCKRVKNQDQLKTYDIKNANLLALIKCQGFIWQHDFTEIRMIKPSDRPSLLNKNKQKWSQIKLNHDSLYSANGSEPKHHFGSLIRGSAARWL